MDSLKYKASMSREIGAHPGALVTAQRISALFKPTSVALVGASDTAGSLGDIVRRNLGEGGFAGPIYFVNPRHDTIAGQPVHRSILDLPAAADLAVIVAPAVQFNALAMLAVALAPMTRVPPVTFNCASDVGPEMPRVPPERFTAPVNDDGPPIVRAPALTVSVSSIVIDPTAWDPDDTVIT